MGTIVGNFEILEQIASGGMANIYKARQTTLDRIVALKELKSTFKEDSDIVGRFEAEAKGVAKLQHENIITVIDFWHGGGSYYIAMEYLEGADLSRIIERTGPLPINIGLIVASSIARALEYAHERGIIHRDLKPSNILISKEGKAKLTDFGIAHIEEELGGKGSTKAGDYMGTPAYMSPEQSAGKPTGPPTDIWALGCLIYEIFSGQQAYAGDTVLKTYDNIQRGIRAPIPKDFKKDVPWRLRRWINSCLKKKPNKRPTIQRLKAFLQSQSESQNKGDHSLILKNFLEEKKVFEPAEGKTVAKPPPPIRPSVLKRALKPIAAVCAAVLMAVALYALVRSIGAAPLLNRASNVGSFAISAVGRTIEKIRPLLHRGETLPPVSQGQVALPPSPTTEVLSTQPGEFGFIRVVALPWAEIFIDGKKVGLTPTDKRFQVLVGSHTVRLINKYYGAVTKKIEVAKDKDTLVKENLKKEKKKQ